MTKENSSLWIDVNDSPALTRAQENLESVRELTAEEEAAAKDDPALESIMLFAIELEKQGLSPRDISDQVIEKIKEVVPHLTPERNDTPPFDVSVERGIGWGTVVYFDDKSRRSSSDSDDDYDNESWG